MIQKFLIFSKFIFLIFYLLVHEAVTSVLVFSGIYIFSSIGLESQNKSTSPVQTTEIIIPKSAKKAKNCVVLFLIVILFLYIN